MYREGLVIWCLSLPSPFTQKQQPHCSPYMTRAIAFSAFGELERGQSLCEERAGDRAELTSRFFFFFSIALGLELSDTKVYEP